MPAPDAIDQYAAANGFPTLRQRAWLTPTKQSKTVPGQIALCLAGNTAFSVASENGVRGCSNVIQCGAVHYECGRVRDRLTLADKAYEIAHSERQKAREIIGIARVSAGRIPRSQSIPAARHIGSTTNVENAWLGQWLSPEELLLAWIRVHSGPLKPPHSLDHCPASWHFVLTDSRMGLVWLSDIGDETLRILPQAILRIERFGRTTKIRLNHEEWTVRGKSAKLIGELNSAASLPPEPRMREVARLNWTGSHQCTDFIDRVLSSSATRGDALASAAALFLKLEKGSLVDNGELAALTRALGREHLAAACLGELWSEWHISSASGRALVQLLRTHRAEPWALSLHRCIYRAGSKEGSAGQLQSCVELAEHLLSDSQPRLARALLEPQIRDHEGNLNFMSPPGPEELLHTRLYATLSRAAEADGKLDAVSRLKLLQLRPLDADRAECLAQAAPEGLVERAKAVASVLQPGGVFVHAPPANTRPQAALSANLISETLRHPAAQRNPDVLTALQNIVARAPIPDPKHLTAFCQRLDRDRFPEAARATEDASFVLGIGELVVFVSLGDKAVGVRAFEHSPPFLLIGGSHLDPTDPHFLGPSELRFAIGAELLHFRLGHTRVTADEFWAGALMKTGEGIELVATLLPALKGLRLAQRLHQALSKLPPGTLGRLATAANQAGGKLLRANAESSQLAPLNEELLEATRLLQLSADRAGLLLSRDPAAAVRAMLLTRRDQLPLFESLKTRSLEQVLASPPIDGRSLGNLHLRVGALIEFYLSENFARLCFEIGQASGR